MGTGLEDPTATADKDAGLDESTFNILDRDNPDTVVACVARFLGFGASLWATGEITSAVAGGVEGGSFEVIDSMPEGSVVELAVADHNAAQPAPAVALQTTSPGVNDPFANPSITV